MRRLLTAFRDQEDGAVTVDWILLTAGVVGFCIAAYSVTENATLGLRDGVSAELTRQNDF
jgi:Flp pilus assembly pilin Flp